MFNCFNTTLINNSIQNSLDTGFHSLHFQRESCNLSRILQNLVCDEELALAKLYFPTGHSLSLWNYQICSKIKVVEQIR